MSEACQRSESGRVCIREAEHEGRHNDGAIEWFDDEQEHPLRGGHPLQPIALDAHGVARFKKNHIVEFPRFQPEDWEQLAQLIGYSVSGFGDLSYVSNGARDEADAKVEQLVSTKG